MGSRSRNDNFQSGDGASPGKIFIGGFHKDTTNTRASVHGASSIRKTGSFVTPISLKSPVATASAFESVGESDDDDDNLADSANLDASYLQANGDMPADANGEQISMAASSVIRSHSVSGDLHGVQPDPIAADILRKDQS